MTMSTRYKILARSGEQTWTQAESDGEDIRNDFASLIEREDVSDAILLQRDAMHRFVVREIKGSIEVFRAMLDEQCPDWILQSTQ